MPGLTRTTHSEESAEVEVLFANMDKLNDLTKKIQSSLHRIDNSGQIVQDAIGPIFGNTSRLQVTNANIDQIHAAIDRIRKPLDKRRGEDNIIRGGLHKAGLADYLSAIERTKAALSEMTNTNFRSNQQAISDLKTLLKIGDMELENCARDTLLEESTQVEPLRFITKQLPFPSLSEQASSKLRQINNVLSQGNSTNAKTVSVYAEIRGPYVAHSLQNLAAASVTTVRKTNAEALYARGTSGIGTYCEALRKMFETEHDNIYPIFEREQWTRLHSMTCQDTMAQLANTLRELHTHIKNNLLTDCFLGFEVVGIVTDLCFRLDTKNPELRQPIQDALRPIRKISEYALQKLLQDITSRVGALMTLPADGSALQVTNDAMTRLQSMTPYLATLSSLLAALGDGGWKPSGQKSGEQSTSTSQAPTLRSFSEHELFVSYATDTIDTLLGELEKKAAQLSRSRAVQGVFLCNNVAVVGRLVHNSDLASVLADTPAPQKLGDWRRKAIGFYADQWRDPVKPLRDVQYTNRTSGPGSAAASSGAPNRTSGNVVGAGGPVDSGSIVRHMSGKDKDATKEKFKAFNTAFDDLVAKHKMYHFEREIREPIVKEITLLIDPLYSRFWDRYHEVDKGKGKYVKYDTTQVRAVLNGLA